MPSTLGRGRRQKDLSRLWQISAVMVRSSGRGAHGNKFDLFSKLQAFSGALLFA